MFDIPDSHFKTFKGKQLKFVKQVVKFTHHNHTSGIFDYDWKGHNIIRYFLQVRLRFLWNNLVQNRGYPETFIPALSDGNPEMFNTFRQTHKLLVDTYRTIKVKGGHTVDIVHSIDGVTRLPFFYETEDILQDNLCLEVELKYDKNDKVL